VFLWLAICAGFALALTVTPEAIGKGSQNPALQLAQRYAPVMEIKKQRDPCDTLGEGYRPTSVNTVLGNPQVKLLRFPQGASSPLAGSGSPTTPSSGAFASRTPS
jgi:hypothetical protein